jgi:hypothetical protein
MDSIVNGAKIDAQKFGDKREKGQTRFDKLAWHRGKPVQFRHVWRRKKGAGAFGQSVAEKSYRHSSL